MSAPEIVAWVALGLVVGTHAGAIGAGGGFLVTPLPLIRFPSASPAEITAASLVVVLATSVAATVSPGANNAWTVRSPRPWQR